MPNINSQHPRSRVSLRTGTRPSSLTSPVEGSIKIHPHDPLAESVDDNELLHQTKELSTTPPSLIEAQHPLAKHSLSRLRDLQTKRPDFRAHSHRVFSLLLADATRDLALREGPSGFYLAKPIVFLALGAEGLSITREAAPLLPGALVGNVGYGADSEVRLHLLHAPALSEATVLLCDPILRAGGQVNSALAFLRQQGAHAVRVVTLVSARDAAESLSRTFPGTRVFACAFDERTDDKGMPVPGIGIFPQRYHGE
ncbi:MAG: uracil phosphoribosyltransferase [Opitutaceae bacterium]|nr:uracil phosphoribosyltransferase [Opitutaceae bacterium]